MISKGLQTIQHLGLSTKELLDVIDMKFVKTIWLGGSVIEGLGNSGSDIDIFVLVEQYNSDIPKLKTYEGHEVSIKYQKNRRVDYEYWSLSYVDDLLKRFNSVDFTCEKTNVLGLFAEDDITFLHRLLKGSCIFNEEVFNQIRKNFSQHDLSSYLYELKSLYVDDAFDDTAGIYLAGDYRTAALRVRQLVEFSIDCLLHCYDETNTSEKYRLPLMRRLVFNNPNLYSFYEKYWQLLSANLPSHRDCKKHVKTSLAFSEELMNHTYLKLGREVGAIGDRL